VPLFGCAILRTMVVKCAIVGSHSMNEFRPGSVEVPVLQRRVPGTGHVIMTPVDIDETATGPVSPPPR